MYSSEKGALFDALVTSYNFVHLDSAVLKKFKWSAIISKLHQQSSWISSFVLLSLCFLSEMTWIIGSFIFTAFLVWRTDFLNIVNIDLISCLFKYFYSRKYLSLTFPHIFFLSFFLSDIPWLCNLYHSLILVVDEAHKIKKLDCKLVNCLKQYNSEFRLLLTVRYLFSKSVYLSSTIVRSLAFLLFLIWDSHIHDILCL